MENEMGSGDSTKECGLDLSNIAQASAYDEDDSQENEYDSATRELHQLREDELLTLVKIIQTFTSSNELPDPDRLKMLAKQLHLSLPKVRSAFLKNGGFEEL